MGSDGRTTMTCGDWLSASRCFGSHMPSMTPAIRMRSALIEMARSEAANIAVKASGSTRTDRVNCLGGYRGLLTRAHRCWPMEACTT